MGSMLCDGDSIQYRVVILEDIEHLVCIEGQLSENVAVVKFQMLHTQTQVGPTINYSIFMLIIHYIWSSNCYGPD